MSVLESFYYQFSNRGLKEARAEVTNYDKQIDELARKGKKRTDDENKQLQLLRKQRGDTIRDVKDQTKESDKLGQSYVKIAQSIGGVITAYLSLNAVKGGLGDAQKNSVNLAVQSKWLGQNAKDLAAYGAAAIIAGGSSEGFLSDLQKIHDNYAQLGLRSATPDFIKNLTDLADIWDKRFGNNLQAKETEGLRFGLSQGTILLLSQGSAKVKEFAEEQKKLQRITDEGNQISFEHLHVTTSLSSAYEGLFQVLKNDLYPAFDAFLKLIIKAIVWLQDHPRFAEAFIAALGAIAVSATFALVPLAGLAAHFTALAAAMAAVTAAAAALPDLSFEAGEFIGRQANKLLGRGDAEGYLPGQRPAASSPSANAPLGIRSNNPGNLQPGGREAVYGSPQEGLAALGNQLRRYGKRGINTLAGIASIYPDPKDRASYLAALVANTGFGANQPLDLNDPAVLAKISSAIIRQENGVNPYNQSQILSAISAGQQALNTAGASSYNYAPGNNSGKSISVSIDEVNVHTQATDVKGITGSVATSLKNAIRSTISNIDDGILA